MFLGECVGSDPSSFFFFLPQVIVFPSACRRRLSNGYVSWRVCWSDPSSPVPSVVLTLYADATDRGTLAWVTKGLSKREFSRGLVPRPL